MTSRMGFLFFFFFGLGRIIIGSLMCLVSDSSVNKDAKHFPNKPQSPAGRGVALQAFLNFPKKCFCRPATESCLGVEGDFIHSGARALRVTHYLVSILLTQSASDFSV